MCAIQNGSGGTAIFGKFNQLRVRKGVLKKDESIARSPAKTIDALVGIAYRKNVGGLTLLAREFLQDFDLRKVRVLEFIHENESSAGTLALQQGPILRQQLVGTQDLMAECAKIFFSQHALDGFKDECNFPASSQSFFVGYLVGVFGFRHS